MNGRSRGKARDEEKGRKGLAHNGMIIRKINTLPPIKHRGFNESTNKQSIT
jgi:hypothetical protein